MDYFEASEYFKADKIRELSLSNEGLRFLKIRSISRKEQMKFVIDRYGINVRNLTSKEWPQVIFESNVSTEAINESIFHLYELKRSERRRNENQLIDELYRVQSFEWGGLHRNNLEKTIVDNYVKKIASYDVLSNAIDNELHHSLRSYVLASWYNHWSSIIIEDIFKDHKKVIPAVGLIKKIDFFINDKPFDLKVTYLPEGFIKDERKSSNLRPELTLMKKLCRELNIGYNPSLSNAVLISDLWKKLDDHPNTSTSELITELREYRERLLDKLIEEPEILVRWLYENQGARRFDASNRFFLILIDKNDFFNSWKLKRAKPLIQEKIDEYLDNTNNVGFKLDFEWNQEVFTTESDVIFIIKS